MSRSRRPRRPGACGAEAGVDGPGAASSRSVSCVPPTAASRLRAPAPSATLSLAPAAWNAGLARLRPAAHPTVTGTTVRMLAAAVLLAACSGGPVAAVPSSTPLEQVLRVNLAAAPVSLDPARVQYPQERAVLRQVRSEERRVG